MTSVLNAITSFTEAISPPVVDEDLFDDKYQLEVMDEVPTGLKIKPSMSSLSIMADEYELKKKQVEAIEEVPTGLNFKQTFHLHLIWLMHITTCSNEII
jgi:hypothetical protein